MEPLLRVKSMMMLVKHAVEFLPMIMLTTILARVVVAVMMATEGYSSDRCGVGGGVLADLNAWDSGY